MALLPQQQLLDVDWVLSLADKARSCVDQTRSRNTVRGYSTDWIHFLQWCADHAVVSLPAEPGTIVLYLTDLAAHAKVSTLSRRLSAISHAHETAGHESPTHTTSVRRLIAGMRRSRPEVSAAKRPVLVADLKAMLDQLAPCILGFRDRALLLLGFAGGFRRSELVALDCADLEQHPDGLKVSIPRAGTAGGTPVRQVAIPSGNRQEGTCPVFAVETWLTAAGIESGPVFRVVNRHGHVLPNRLSGEAVSLVLKRLAGNAGYDPAEFAGHSLRAGLATSAAMAGKSELSIMRQTGHRSVAAVRRYVREANLFCDNAAEGLGL